MNSCTSRPRSPMRPIDRDVGVRRCAPASTSAPTCRRPSRQRCPCAGPRTGGEGVEHAHAEIERRADPVARMRRRRRGAQRIGRGAARQRPLAVDRLAHGIDHAAQPGLGRPDRRRQCARRRPGSRAARPRRARTAAQRMRHREKPTISHGDAAGRRSRSSTRPPTRSRVTGPTTSISRPCTVSTRPKTSTSSIARSAAVRLASDRPLESRHARYRTLSKSVNHVLG